MNRWSAMAMLLAIAGALIFRVPKLATRPLHNDEAVNAVKVAGLWQDGRYVYDPDEYHGPTLYYATLPFLWLSAARHPGELDDATLRFAPVAFGVGLIPLLLLFAPGLGRSAVAWAGLFIAVSPAMVFYSRYFIHEMVLVFFTALTLGASWRYWQTRSAGWAVLAGTGMALMYTTKETFVISVAALGLAGIATAWGMMEKPKRIQGLLALWNWRHFALALGAGFMIWLLLFSSFFTNFAGLLDSFRTYLPWLKRAGGQSPHIHPWYFYLHRLAWFHPAKSPVWTEGLILVLAIIGATVSLVGRKSHLHRFLALYTLILTVAYCTISYKTPWCLLNFYYGMILLAGVGAATLVASCRAAAMKIVTIALLLALTLQLSAQTRRANFVYAADPRNPYVYAQTSPELVQLVQRINGIARVAPSGYQTVVKVMATDNDYWPMPWYLQRFQHVDLYDRLPDDPFAPIVLVSSKLNARLDDKSDRKWIMAGIFALRPGKFFELYVELELWKKFVATRPPGD